MLIITGLMAGTMGGMLGVGGSLVMIPALTELIGPDQHLYQATAMIVNFFVVVPAVYHHRRAKAIEPETVIKLIPLAILAIIVGVTVSELQLFSGEGEAYLRGLFGLFLFFVCAYDLYRLLIKKGSRTPKDAIASQTHPTKIRWSQAAMIAIPTGLIAGLLGVGGGVMAVPLQCRLLHIPIRNAIANSATLIIATSTIGACMKNYAYYVDNDHTFKAFILASCLIPTAILGGLLGSRLTHVLPLKIVKTAFFILLAVVAVRLTWRSLHSEAPSQTTTVLFDQTAPVGQTNVIEPTLTLQAQLSERQIPIPQDI